MKYCRCDAVCTTPSIKAMYVCGYNEEKKLNSTFENICLMKKVSCKYEQKIRMVHEGRCGKYHVVSSKIMRLYHVVLTKISRII